MTLDWHQSSASHLANLYRQICLGEGKYIFRVLYMGFLITDTRKTKKGYVKNVTLQYFW